MGNRYVLEERNTWKLVLQKEKKNPKKADDEQRKSKESREGLDQILEDFAWKLG